LSDTTSLPWPADSRCHLRRDCHRRRSCPLICGFS